MKKFKTSQYSPCKILYNILGLKLIVYIEQVVIDNVVINYILLFLTGKILSLNIKKSRIFIASFFGMLVTLVYPLLSFDGILLLIFKTLLGIVIISISFEYKTLKKFLLIFLTFVFLTGIFGGLIFAILLAISPDLKLENGTFIYTHNVPIGVYILITSIIAKVSFDIFSQSKKRISFKQLEYQMKVKNKGKEFDLKVFLDTGNLLLDTKTQKPVIVVSFKTFKKIFNLKTHDFILGNYIIPSSRYISVQFATKSARMLIFPVDSVEIFSNEKTKSITNAILGLGTFNFSFFGCDAIVGKQVMV